MVLSRNIPCHSKETDRVILWERLSFQLSIQTLDLTCSMVNRRCVFPLPSRDSLSRFRSSSENPSSVTNSIKSANRPVRTVRENVVVLRGSIFKNRKHTATIGFFVDMEGFDDDGADLCVHTHQVA